MSASDTYDLTILYMSDVTNWCEYLFDIFNPFDVYQQSEEITEFPTHESTIENIRNSRVQVLIISPKFIETVTHQIGEITGRDSVIGLLCGVDEEELPRLCDRVPDYTSWHLVNAKDGPTAITKITLEILDSMIKAKDQYGDNHYVAMGKEGKQEDTYIVMEGNNPESNYTTMGTGKHDDQPTYLPMGQTHVEDEDLYLRMTAANDEELYSEMTGPETDNVYVKPENVFQDEVDYSVPVNIGQQQQHQQQTDAFDDTYDACRINNDFQDTYDTCPFPGTLQITKNCTVYPEKLRAGVREKVIVMFKKGNLVENFEGSYKIHIASESRKTDVNPKVINPYTLQFEFPAELPGGKYNCIVYHNGKQSATVRLQVQSASTVLSDILAKALNPLTFLCESLEISPADTNQLDNRLHSMCKDLIPQDGLAFALEDGGSGKQTTRYPTPLHFAAEFGLVATSAKLCQWPGAKQALKLRNMLGQTPEEMTQNDQIRSYLGHFKDRHSHDNPANSYVRMNEKPKATDGETGGYDRPFPVPIPAPALAPEMGDEQIKGMIKGEIDIYDIYNPEPMIGNMVRDDDEDDDTQDYETVESSLTEGTVGPHPADQGPGPRKPPTDERLTRETDEKLQSLIDIQNKVKDNKITMDQAVILFKEWEQSHKIPQTFKAPGGAGDRQSKVSKFINRNFFTTNRESYAGPVQTQGAVSSSDSPSFALAAKPHKDAALRSVSANTYGISPQGKGPRPDIGERQERPTPPVLPRVANGHAEHCNIPTTEGRKKNRRSIHEPDLSKSKDRPIPPIPPRVSSSSIPSKPTLTGAKAVLPPTPSQTPIDRDTFDSSGSPLDDLPERVPPPPPNPRRSSQDNKASLETPRRQSDPSVTPGPNTKPRPTPRPRVLPKP